MVSQSVVQFNIIVPFLGRLCWCAVKKLLTHSLTVERQFISNASGKIKTDSSSRLCTCGLGSLADHAKLSLDELQTNQNNTCYFTSDCNSQFFLIILNLFSVFYDLPEFDQMLMPGATKFCIIVSTVSASRCSTSWIYPTLYMPTATSLLCT